MSDCLGYDIDGQPLRAGDRVVIVEAGAKPESVDGYAVVIGPNAHPLLFPGKPEISIDGPSGIGDIWCDAVRKLQPKQADNEATTWESIEQLTGWVPEGVQV